MRRLNFLEDEPWDEVQDDRRVRWFGYPLETDMLGASLIELLPGTPGSPLHLHYGVEEMFFVLAGTPTVRTPKSEDPTDQPARILAISTKRFPDVLAYPERGVAWVATRHPERPVPEGGGDGIIGRFELSPNK
jgi:mannose-6-phosphate isomerase-like protein (cupin superfamily)